MRRGFWFVAGAGAGVYVMVRARRAAETFTPDGQRDRVAGLGVGAHLFAEEVRSGMAERETELRERFGLALHAGESLAVIELAGQSARPSLAIRNRSSTEVEGTH
jgi:hypothetical protein